jgi:two-component system, NarL family, sensor histidine kinase UhpB
MNQTRIRTRPTPEKRRSPTSSDPPASSRFLRIGHQQIPGDRVAFATVLLALVVFGAATLLAIEVGLRLQSGDPRLASLAVIAGISVLLALPVHFAIMRWTLAPLRVLEDTVARVEAGDLDARVPLGSLTDSRTRGVSLAVNRLLDRVVSDRQRLRDTAARSARAQEAERVRIARELRDDLAQVLASTLLRLRVARVLPEESARNQLLEELGGEIGGSIDRLRRFAQALHPPALHELGVVAAVQAYARTLCSGTSLTAHVQGPDLAGVLAPEQGLAIYRIVQEALANAARHAGAKHLRVNVEIISGNVITRVEDDGAGFDVREMESSLPCLGLFSMRERALAVGGTLDVESAPGSGTRVTLSIPLQTRGRALQARWPTILPNLAPPGSPVPK